MNPCRKCQQAGDKNHNCGMPKSFRLECGAVEESPQNLAKPDACSLLAEVRAVLEDIVEGEYRLFHSDSMDQDTGLEEKTRLLYEKVKRAF